MKMVNLDHKLKSLPEEKRQKILQAAISEFAENGYEKASTNAIVKGAGIAKGLLFHYFGSKKNLYLYALEHAIDFYVDYFMKSLGNLPGDLLDRLMRWAELKLRMFSEHPLMYRMGVTTIQDVPPDVKAEVSRIYSRTTERLMPAFLEGVDSSCLREGVDARKALQFVMLAINGISEKFLAAARTRPDRGLADLPSALREMEDYKEMLKYGLYRR
ncbi:MAG: TetR/AcrR family transcriptional regulator [Bacillota bacterium]